MKKFVKILLIVLGVIIALIVLLVLAVLILFPRAMAKQEKQSGFYEDWSEKDGVKIENVVYGDHERHRYDIYYPTDGRKDDAALVLFIHGGSWMGGDKADRDDECHRLAKEGYVTASMNYRLLGPTSEASIEAMLDDIASCIEAIRSESAAAGYNISQMAISGQSAGAHLAMLFGLKMPERSAIPIRFIANLVGPADMENVLMGNEFAQEMLGEAAALSLALRGRPIGDDEEVTEEFVKQMFADYSPVTFVDEGSVPMVGAYGGKDPLVKPHNYQVMCEAYEHSGVEHRFFLFPEADHSLYGAPKLTADYYKQFADYAKRYFGY